MSERPTIVFLDRDTLPPSVRLKDFARPANLVVHARTRPDEVAARIADADIVVTNKVRVDAAAIAGAPRLKLVALAATGYDPVDVAACEAAGIRVANIRAYATRTLPEHTFALILALRRSLVPYARSVTEGRWEEAGQFCYFDYPIADLAGSTLGVVGDGALGKAVARIAEAFGMEVLFSSYKGVAGMGPLYTPFEEVMARSDVITLHCPLTPQTRNLISDAEFALMRRAPLLINTARGGLVDEAALARALDAGLVSGAGLDVTIPEPPGADHPIHALARRENVLVTPHVAWASREATQALADQLVDNIDAFLAGTPRNLVV
ncbi:D-2-hydroxyacid dehydrogenase [Salinarimonas ramus]|uniref:Glycerate dehydrogenase n=1 Tax=Salinarimonas ramus TaxID=690164 RepID=A0A917Q5E4_9HYPH|nr:D-2-hydroxyacid dehydrogenase [Salinarimonas ramus]GGK26669.1 glycerate dehydrogenase [Salinarimonas ramus]